MSFFKQHYGSLGKLSRGDWLKYLVSNQGLFARQNRAKRVIGPTLDKQGHVLGDMMSIETFSFDAVATKEQKALRDELLRVHPTAAKEYILTIGGSIEIWKEDIMWLETLLHHLDKMEAGMKKVEDTLSEDEAINMAIKVPPVLKKHFPERFQNIEIDNIEFDKLLHHIKDVEEEIMAEDHYLRKYLREKRKEMPFLFER